MRAGLHIITVLALAVGVSSCGPALKEWRPGKKRPHVFEVGFRQLAPEPVYNRARWVHLPELTYPRELPHSSAPLILSVVHFKLVNAGVEESCRLLAKSAGYSSFSAASLAKRRISINSLGSIDELARQIASQAGIEVLIDHRHRHVSCLARVPSPAQGVAPSFLAPQGEELSYEH